MRRNIEHINKTLYCRCIAIPFRIIIEKAMDAARTMTALDDIEPSDLQSLASKNGRRQSIAPSWCGLGKDNSSLPEFGRDSEEIIRQLLAKSEYLIRELNEIEWRCRGISHAAIDYRVTSINYSKYSNQTRSDCEIVVEPALHY
jgi:hypothetical protein